ncbi:LPS assembly lipoprotein LptE [Fuscovulum ytuae]|uniref:LPS assembly lipoprotein LptE n=1 Tax=Fuscovulum ytuae TaxID=3042299 RepID=A0ABY8Q396_9RHOB|nr:LPS assembly lipoprotein LptE [Fuscovulum sp. YMD61]WGV15323.1 LPS assembly lipoprotein LptE [Fuscovulum sp. YMD61]
MSLSDRRQFLFGLSLLPLAACGFTPAYGPEGGASALRGQVEVQTPQSKPDFDFASRIIARLGDTSNAAYSLGYVISASRESGGVTAANVTTRYTLLGSATWTLTEQPSGTRVAGGTVRAFTSWSATGTTVAGLAAEDDAYRRLSVMLADQVILRLLAKAPTLGQ